jgi:hypothetical protein
VKPLNQQFVYKAVARAEENGSRHYVSDSGAKVASVTTILSKTKDPTGLLAWKRRIGESAANQITKESASLGTMMHTHLENWIKGDPRPGGTNTGRVMAAKMADQIISQGLSKVDEVWGIEAPLIYDQFWAGTSDLIGVYKGQPAIMDFKTTIRPKKREHVDDYRLQLTAYMAAHNLMFGTDIRTGVIFMCSRNFEYQEFVWDADQFDKNLSDWVDRVAAYYASHPLPWVS